MWYIHRELCGCSCQGLEQRHQDTTLKFSATRAVGGIGWFRPLLTLTSSAALPDHSSGTTGPEAAAAVCQLGVGPIPPVRAAGPGSWRR